MKYDITEFVGAAKTVPRRKGIALNACIQKKKIWIYTAWGSALRS